MTFSVLAILFVAMAAMAMATAVASAIGQVGFPLPAHERRMGCVDGLRGYLALAVLVHHFVIWTQAVRRGGIWSSPTSNMLNQFGAGSVGLFFMATGFVFYPRVAAGIAATNWPALYITRVARIVPLVVVATLSVTAIVVLRTGHPVDARYPGEIARWITSWGEPDLLAYPRSGQINAFVLWSLWYEWLFYLFVLPGCAMAATIVSSQKWPIWVVPVGLLIVGIVGRSIVSRGGASPGLLTYLPLFAAGMIAFELRAMASIRLRLVTVAAAIASGLILAIGMICWREPYYGALILFASFFTCVGAGNTFGGVLSSRGALVLGECSFGIYLLHGIVLDILFVDFRATGANGFPGILGLPLAVLIVVLVTPVTYLVVERPAIRGGKRLARRLTRAGVVPRALEVELAP